MHETIHQFKVLDHYCYEDGTTEEDPCTNDGCYMHKGNGIKPNCMMMDNKYPSETHNLLCPSCKSQIISYLSDR